MMGEWIDLEADIGYYEGNIGGIYLTDENGEYEPMEFVSKERDDKLDKLGSRLIDLEATVSDFVDDMPCDECAIRRDCIDDKHILCRPSFVAIEEMRDIIETLDEIVSTTESEEQGANNE